MAMAREFVTALADPAPIRYCYPRMWTSGLSRSHILCPWIDTQLNID